MERVAFLVEETQESLRCLLNPESLVIRRWAGLRPRTHEGNRLAGSHHRDDPLLFVGGGWTELELDLLFDVELAGSTIAAQDVRELTGPLRRLAENPEESRLGALPSLVRFLWGRAWNEPCLVLAIAERLERFTPEGIPRRSWLSLRLRRVVEAPEPKPVEPALQDALVWPTPDTDVPEELIQVRELPPQTEAASTDQEGPAGPAASPRFDRPDLLSFELYGTPFLWRLFAYYGSIDDPLRLPRDRALQAPPPTALRTSGRQP